MKVFLPVSTYRVAYQPVTGRPYSLFERSLLEAVDSGISTPSELVELFAVHRSVVIQGMVTLMYAGWIALTAGQRVTYTVTKAGKLALKRADSLPPGRLILKERSAKIIMERLWGSICKLAELTFVQLGRVKKVHKSGEPYLVLTPEFSSDPEPNKVRRLISVAEEERVLYVGPVTIDRSDCDWAMLDVDVESQSITGLPQAWIEELTLQNDILDKAHWPREYWRVAEFRDEIDQADDVKEQASFDEEPVFNRETLVAAELIAADDQPDSDVATAPQRERGGATMILSKTESGAESAGIVSKASTDIAIQAVPPVQDSPRFEDDDESDRRDLWLQDREFEPPTEHVVFPGEIGFLSGWQTNEEFFLERLAGREEAASYLVVHSESLRIDSVDRMYKTLVKSLMRGLNINFLWGVGPPLAVAASHKRALDKLLELEKASQSAVPGRLIVGKQPTGLRWNVLVCDSKSVAESIVGTHRWMGFEKDESLSVRTTAPGLVASVFRCLTDMMQRSNDLSRSYNLTRLRMRQVSLMKRTQDAT